MASIGSAMYAKDLAMYTSIAALARTKSGMASLGSAMHAKDLEMYTSIAALQE